MTISYKWLSDYLPEEVKPERLAQILTSIGLEVESEKYFEEFKGGLKGLVIGEVISCEKHPNADKLKLTKVNTGGSELLNIVCGAPNVAVAQKVIVAPVGATIYPLNGDPVTMKLAKIRGEQSEGMICAEDEIGISASHAGIMVLPNDVKPGTAAADYFGTYNDTVFEIGLTPNRMDAMSHWGVAKDVCAYLSHHDKKEVLPVLPTAGNIEIPKDVFPINVTVENTAACPRYSGISIAGIEIKESPKWLQHKLKAIGLRPINNVVDITNFILHETGQPLHAFDADEIRGNVVIVKNLPEGTLFVTLDEKERKLSADDLMICDAEGGMCIAGVFGGLHSGVTAKTKNIFLESACFDGVTLRKTSFKHALRTDAATRFEKGTDISATVEVLKRAAQLITSICGGKIVSDIVDIYADPKPKTEVILKYDYLTRLSGKHYSKEAVKTILTSLGFVVKEENETSLNLLVPFSKPDISLPADIVEEVLRIDGLDNVEIPTSIMISPAVEENYLAEVLKEKLSNYMVGLGFNEILTNSITNKAYFSEAEMATVVKMKNSLSAELNIMRPNMIETGLEVIAHNLNHKNEDLKLYEFGKTYALNKKGGFDEPEHFCIYIVGEKQSHTWKGKAIKADFFTIKGIVEQLFKLLGIKAMEYAAATESQFEQCVSLFLNQKQIGSFGAVSKKMLQRFDIKQQVFFADLNWEPILNAAKKHKTVFSPVSKFPAVQRDLAMVVPKELKYEQVEQLVKKLNLKKLQSTQLFDVFESDKLGAGKKSFAVNFIFIDEEKTLTDAEIDGFMKKIMQALEKDLQAEIRK